MTISLSRALTLSLSLPLPLPPSLSLPLPPSLSLPLPPSLSLFPKVIAEAEAERTGRHVAEVELAKVQKELKRVQARLDDETSRQSTGVDETEEALQEVWESVREERRLRQEAEERLEQVIDFLRAHGVDIPSLREAGGSGEGENGAGDGAESLTTSPMHA